MLYSEYINDFVPYAILYVGSWIFFIRGNHINIRSNFNTQVKLRQSKIDRNKTNTVFVDFSTVIICYLGLISYLSTGYEEYFFSNQCYKSSTNLYYLQNSLILAFLMWHTLKNTPEANNIANTDFFFSLLNVSLAIPLLYFTSTFYSFLFVVELISVMIFYKLSVSSLWIKKRNTTFKKKKVLEKTSSKGYNSVVFFQYWINFFSSIVLLFSVTTIISIYGSAEWFFLNFVNLLNKENWYLSDFEFNILIWIPLFFSLFFKIGLAPTHLFKLEIYKGIPFISIFFYTTYYFMAYFLICVVFFKNYLPTFSTSWWFFLVIFTVIGLGYIISLLFDVIYTKSFFAYSTVVNSIGFMILVVATI